jgi:CRISPR-associated endonuclease/helicase Cas3/CRISPR-associated endonuclease Cas3-HD
MIEGDTRYSHPPENGRPAVRLIDHLHDVRDRVGIVVPDDATTSHGEPLVDIVEKLALVHDFGKATTWFQQHIGVLSGKPEFDEKRYHAPLGSFAAYYVLRESGYTTETCVAGFVAVAKHHGQLPDVAKYVKKRSTETSDDDSKLDAVAHQVKNIHDESQPLAEQLFEEATGDPDAWIAFAVELAQNGTLFDEVADQVTVGETAKTDAFSDEFYGLLLQMWGTLVLADKTSAAGADLEESVYAATKPKIGRLDRHVADLEADAHADPGGSQTEQLNHFRSRARTDVLDGVSEFVDSTSNVATITLPTGMGKTLTGLSAALELRDATGGERVVYALPFTSIIDQVVDEARDIFDTDGTDGLLATHHHLADTQINPEAASSDESAHDMADWNDDIAGMLGEGWRAGLTVTTFVQLFETLAGPRNTQSMKLSALRGSVVVLDEPQSLPFDWWKLVPRLIRILTEQYEATVIAMTATQPQLFDDATELVDDVDDYFEVAERVTYSLHDSTERFLADGSTAEPLDYDSAADELAVDARSDTSVLSICNTIDSARRLTDFVTNRLGTVDVAETYLAALRDDAGDPVEATVAAVQTDEAIPFVHLSTRMRPADRLALVKTIKKLRSNDVQVVAVTTQLVEAGVDVSFEAVYRDLAPVDSVVQAAGRCNRSFEQKRGEVTVWWLAEPGDQRDTPAVAVYDHGTSLTPVTATALDAVRQEEGELSGLAVSRRAVEEYYERLHKDKNVGRDTYAELVDAADGKSLAALSLIDTTRSIDVIVCLTDEDEALVDNLKEAHRNYEFDRIDELLDETKPLRVSVPIYDSESPEADAVTNLPPLVEHEGESDVRVLRPNSTQHEQYFESTTGFVVPDDSVEARFL